MSERKSANIGVWIFFSVLLVVVAFFVFANMARGDSERQKETSKAELNSCLLRSENEYNEDLKINSTGSRVDENGKTVFTGSGDVFDKLVAEKQSSDALCYKTYSNN